jgi:ABC-type transport system involved in cytochrome bd biosynthesis fused ATPase/permease subunit
VRLCAQLSGDHQAAEDLAPTHTDHGPGWSHALAQRNCSQCVPPLDARPAPQTGTPCRTGDKCQLEASGLTYHYPESGQGITGVNLRLARGSLTVITGRIGAGKTMLLRVLLGLLPIEQHPVRHKCLSLSPLGDLLLLNLLY